MGGERGVRVRAPRYFKFIFLFTAPNGRTVNVPASIDEVCILFVIILLAIIFVSYYFY